MKMVGKGRSGTPWGGGTKNDVLFGGAHFCGNDVIWHKLLCMLLGIKLYTSLTNKSYKKVIYSMIQGWSPRYLIPIS